MKEKIKTAIFLIMLCLAVALILIVRNKNKHTKIDLPEEFPLVMVNDKLNVYKIDTIGNTITIYLEFDHTKK